MTALMKYLLLICWDREQMKGWARSSPPSSSSRPRVPTEDARGHDDEGRDP